MPFFDDNGIDEDTLHSPIWGTFTVLKDNLERLIALNLCWSVNLVPGLIGMAFPSLPLWLRIPLVIYSILVMAPATGTLYVMVAGMNENEPPQLDTIWQTFRAMLIPSIRVIAPLYGLIGCLFWTIVFLAPLRLVAVDTLLQLCLLFLLFLSTYWGPALGHQPQQSLWQTIRETTRLAFRYPYQTLISDAIILLALILGAISIGGLFLIVPVLVAIAQTFRYQDLLKRERVKQQKYVCRRISSSSVTEH